MLELSYSMVELVVRVQSAMDCGGIPPLLRICESFGSPKEDMVLTF